MIDPDQPLVNFLIVGAQRGGTTSLSRYLESHENVFMAPCKEVHFFDRANAPENDWSGTGAKREYESFFVEHAGETAIGEATPTYMYLPEVAERIRAYNPAMKLIFLLREPGERAVSQYRHERQLGFEYLPLWLAFLAEPLRLRVDRENLGERSSRRHHSYCDRGHYAGQIRRFLDLFPREQLLILRSEQLFGEHSACLEGVFDFLGLSHPSRLPEPARHNQAPGSANRQTPAARRVAQTCSPSTRELEDLLEWDLSSWRNS